VSVPAIDRILAWEGLGFLFLLFGATALQLFRMPAVGKGLLEGRTRSGRRFASPGRVQLLIATVVAAFLYVSQVIKDPSGFPDFPANWLLLFGASHMVYLGGKYFSLRGTPR